MKIHVQAIDFELTEALETIVRDKTRKAMRASADIIELVEVRLRDLNGPKGGRDKECTVEVVIPDHPSIVVCKRGSDAYACVRKTLARAARVTLRRIAKRRVTSLSRKVRERVLASSLRSRDDNGDLLTFTK